jgi:hypothetical protein
MAQKLTLKHLAKAPWLFAMAVLCQNCTPQGTNDIDGLKDEILRLKKTMEMQKPGLGEIMSNIQWHHEKLYFSGQAGNWDLASYEFNEIEEDLGRGTELYEHIKEVTAPLPTLKHLTDSSLKEIQQAIVKKNQADFMKGFNGLTISCNQCHQATNHGFIVIQLPKASAFSNQRLTK